MKISYLTLTGADDKIDPLALAKLSDQYPFIEWAILISDQREGTSRYPTKEWRNEFYKALPNSNKAAHLCGKEVLSRLVAEDAQLTAELNEYQRVQLNFNAKHMDESILKGLIRCTASGIYHHNSGVGTQFITQYNESNQDITLLFNHANRNNPDIHGILFDASGGLGKSPDAWPKPFTNKLCGYAGGLGPDNIVDELNNIRTTVGTQFGAEHTNLWIDMESKLRTNEDFDLAKAHEVAAKVKSWMVSNI